MGQVPGERPRSRKGAFSVGTRSSCPLGKLPHSLRQGRRRRVPGLDRRGPPAPRPRAAPYLSRGAPAPPAGPRAPRACPAAPGPVRPGRPLPARPAPRPSLPGGISFNFGICSIPNVKDPQTSVPWGIPRPRGKRGQTPEAVRGPEPRAGAGPRVGAPGRPQRGRPAGTPTGALRLCPPPAPRRPRGETPPRGRCRSPGGRRLPAGRGPPLVRALRPGRGSLHSRRPRWGAERGGGGRGAPPGLRRRPAAELPRGASQRRLPGSPGGGTRAGKGEGARAR